MPPEGPAPEPPAPPSLLRNHGGGHAPVSYLELFFDLVFVFAITQLSHTLHHHLGWHGLLEGVVMFLAVWWGWIYTTWVTNWANPDRLPVRLILLAVMLCSLLLAVAIPGAFGDKGLLFAGGYVALQLGRSTAMAVLFRREGSARMRNMARIAAWFAASAPLWLVGALADDPNHRIAWWLAALAIEYAGPMLMFPVPVLGKSTGADWDISGSHMAERCSLFIIIALGEGIVVTGSSVAGAELVDGGLLGALGVAFAGSALMWWLYFDLGAERGARLISGHAQVGRLARNAYTYLHMPIVLAIIICAVGDALLLEHWNEPAGRDLVLVQTGGLMLFIGGLAAFKRFANTIRNFPLSHGVAMLLFALLGTAAWFTPIRSVAFAGWGVGILLLTAVWEWVSYHGGWAERMEAMGIPYPKRAYERFEARRAERDGD